MHSNAGFFLYVNVFTPCRIAGQQKHLHTSVMDVFFIPQSTTNLDPVLWVQKGT